MAVPNQNQSQNINTTGSRRLKYGSNLILLLIIAIVIVGMLGFLSNKFHHPYDWSTGGLFTLSGQTKKLLEDVDNKKQTYEIVDHFAISREPSAAEVTQAQQVHDLLDLYTHQSGNIKFWEPKSPEEQDAKIRERFKDEIKPYEQSVKSFDPLAANLDKFFQDQSSGFTALAQTRNLSPDDVRDMQSIANAFAKVFPKLIKQTQHDVRDDIEATAPAWTKAKTEIIQAISSIGDGLKQLTGPNTDGINKVIQDYLKQNAAAYTGIIKQIDDYKASLDKLPPLKIDDIRDSIGPNTLILFGPDTVKVIGAADIFQPDTKNAADPAHPKMLFQGEQAVSTALMAMVRPNKPKVVFISASAQQLLAGPFSEINDRLTKANFDVSEWSPPGAPNPEQPPQSPTPPASGTDASGKPVVWIVLPPDAPNMQQLQQGMPPPDPRPLVEAVKKHMDAGGNVMFLAEAASPMAAMMGGGGYPYADLIKPFGIQVKDTYAVLRTTRVSEEATRAVPEILFTDFPHHEITDPIQSLRTLFLGTFTQNGLMGAPTVVDIASPVPPGAQPAVIVETPASAEIFATANTSVANPEFDPKTDLKAPLSMGAVSILNTGKTTQRIIVMGNKLFLVSQILQQPTMDQNGNMIYAFPGNAELMVNCVSWLSGYENMIAVSPQANVAQRIVSMSPTQAMLVRLGSFIVPPLLAIMIGTVIFFVRRRA